MNIFVGNLSYDVTDDDLRKEFELFGEVTSVSIMKDSYSGQSRGFGFVEMPKLSEGQAALTALNGKSIKNRAISVSGARPRTENRSFGGNKKSGKPSHGKKGGGYGGGRGGMKRY